MDYFANNMEAWININLTKWKQSVNLGITLVIKTFPKLKQYDRIAGMFWCSFYINFELDFSNRDRQVSLKVF